MKVDVEIPSGAIYPVGIVSSTAAGDMWYHMTGNRNGHAYMIHNYQWFGKYMDAFEEEMKEFIGEENYQIAGMLIIIFGDENDFAFKMRYT